MMQGKLFPVLSALMLPLLLVLLPPDPVMSGQSADTTDSPVSFAFQLSTLDGTHVRVDRKQAPDDQTDVPDADGGARNAVPAATVVCFLGAECPMVKLYSSRLSQLAAQYSTRGVQFVGINSNRQDTDEDIRQYLDEHPLTFPLVRDPQNMVADQYGATRTPEIFLLDGDLRLRYRGRIDDQYAPGVARPAASRNDLQQALEQLLAGEAVAVAETEAVGCLIGKHRAVRTSPVTESERVTWTGEVSRLLQKHCLECHRPGEIGPFSMESYDHVVGWAATMLETVEQHRMPPWHADPAHGEFRNARVMTSAEQQILRDWVDAGMPYGDPQQLPEPIEYAEGWRLPAEPDRVVSMGDRPYQLPAEGTVEYQYFVVDPGFTEDRWVNAAQVLPGNRAVVHHAIVFIRPPDGSAFRGVGWLTAFVPGQRSFEMPPGHARRIPAGSRLVFQMHYTTSGSPQLDLTQVGMIFVPEEEVTHEVITVVGIDQEFEIPPHVSRHEVSGTVRWFPRNGRLLAIAPHMHVRGREFELNAEQGARSRTLLRVPRYDFNWQHSYELSDPLDLSSVDRLAFRVVFDNSAKNPFNPDPTQWVNWGDQTWEEMAVAFLEVAEPRATAGETASANAATEVVLADEEDSERRRQRLKRERLITEFVDDFFRRLDTNRDGVVQRTEVPLSVRTHFSRFDRNGDGQADRDEVRQVAEERYP